MNEKNDVYQWKKVAQYKAHNFEDVNTLIGIYIGTLNSDLGINYLVQVSNDPTDIYLVFGNKVLSNKMLNVNVGDKIKIVYLGKEKGKTWEYKNFDVYVSEGVKDDKPVF